MADIYDDGYGPAGLTAGIYCARARFKTLMLKAIGSPGLTAFMIENYLAFQTASRPDLMKFIEQKRFGLETMRTVER
jgi:thioredoxin reductase